MNIQFVLKITTRLPVIFRKKKYFNEASNPRMLYLSEIGTGVVTWMRIL